MSANDCFLTFSSSENQANKKKRLMQPHVRAGNDLLGCDVVDEGEKD